MKTSNEFELQLLGYRLATAEILYRMPDHPVIIQSFIWQNLDLAPKFPVLTKFLNYWEENLDGPIYSVTVGSTEIIKPSEFSNVTEFVLH